MENLEGVSIVDSHVHFAGVGCHASTFANGDVLGAYVDSCGTTFRNPRSGGCSGSDLKQDMKNLNISEVVFVECGLASPLEEASWAIGQATAGNYIIKKVVAHVPMTEGAKAVSKFLDRLNLKDGSLPCCLAGGREVYQLGYSNPKFNLCLSPEYTSSLEVLEAHGLL